MDTSSGDRAALQAEVRRHLDEMESAMRTFCDRVDEDNARFEAEYVKDDYDDDDSADSPEFREVAERVARGEFTWTDVLRGELDMRDEPALRFVHNEMYRQVRTIREVFDLRQSGMSSAEAVNAVMSHRGGTRA